MLKPSKKDLEEGVTIPLNSTEGLSSAIKNARPTKQAPSRQGSSVTFFAPEESKGDSNVIAIPEEGDNKPKKGLMEIGKTSKTPIVRIATEAKLRTITHKVKKPAVDIEFHDLVYTAKTPTGELKNAYKCPPPFPPDWDYVKASFAQIRFFCFHFLSPSFINKTVHKEKIILLICGEFYVCHS